MSARLQKKRLLNFSFLKKAKNSPSKLPSTSSGKHIMITQPIAEEPTDISYKNMRGGQSESEGEDGSRNIIIPNKSFVAKPDVAQPCGEGHDKSGKKQNIHYYVKQASHIITSKQEQCLSACGKNTALIK